MGKSIKNIKKLNITWKHLLLDILRNSPTHTQTHTKQYWHVIYRIKKHIDISVDYKTEK